MTLIYMIPAMFGHHTTYFIDISFIGPPFSVHTIELTSLDIGVFISFGCLFMFSKLIILHNFCIYFFQVNVFFDELIPRQRSYKETGLHFHLKSVFFLLPFNESAQRFYLLLSYIQSIAYYNKALIQLPVCLII